MKTQLLNALVATGGMAMAATIPVVYYEKTAVEAKTSIEWTKLSVCFLYRALKDGKKEWTPYLSTGGSMYAFINTLDPENMKLDWRKRKKDGSYTTTEQLLKKLNKELNIKETDCSALELVEPSK